MNTVTLSSIIKHEPRHVGNFCVVAHPSPRHQKRNGATAAGPSIGMTRLLQNLTRRNAQLLLRAYMGLLDMRELATFAEVRCGCLITFHVDHVALSSYLRAFWALCYNSGVSPKRALIFSSALQGLPMAIALYHCCNWMWLVRGSSQGWYGRLNQPLTSKSFLAKHCFCSANSCFFWVTLVGKPLVSRIDSTVWTGFPKRSSHNSQPLESAWHRLHMIIPHHNLQAMMKLDETGDCSPSS